jgi:glutamine synthetase
MPANTSVHDAREFLEANPGIREVDLLIADGNGVLRGKRVRRETLASVYADGLCLAGSVFGTDIAGNTVEKTGLGFDEGDADRICWPVPGTLREVPWAVDRAQLLLTMHETDGRPFFADPRQVLVRVLEQFEELDLVPVVAVELEFYLLDNERAGNGAPLPPISPTSGRRVSQTQVYSIADLDDQADLLADVARACEVQALPAYTAVAEYASGQYEVNLKHRPDPLAACDDAILFKRLLKAVARQHGLSATFMAKPYPESAGSGTHIHLSLLDADQTNVFACADPATNQRLQFAIGGLTQTLYESMALLAPNANSYRRFQRGTYVPLANTWGYNNRTVAIRVPAGPVAATRIEHRIAGADANPYLVVATILAGIHYGLIHECEPGAAISGNAEEQTDPNLPLDWLASLEALDTSEVIMEYLGEDFCNVYLETRAAERYRFARTVTALEYDWYLHAF